MIDAHLSSSLVIPVPSQNAYISVVTTPCALLLSLMQPVQNPKANVRKDRGSDVNCESDRKIVDGKERVRDCSQRYWKSRKKGRVVSRVILYKPGVNDVGSP